MHLRRLDVKISFLFIVDINPLPNLRVWQVYFYPQTMTLAIKHLTVVPDTVVIPQHTSIRIIFMRFYSIIYTALVPLYNWIHWLRKITNFVNGLEESEYLLWLSLKSKIVYGKKMVCQKRSIYWLNFKKPLLFISSLVPLLLKSFKCISSRLRILFFAWKRCFCAGISIETSLLTMLTYLT